MAYIQKIKRKQDTTYRVFILVDKDKRLTKTFKTMDFSLAISTSKIDLFTLTDTSNEIWTLVSKFILRILYRQVVENN